jgi:hypothetical protein
MTFFTLTAYKELRRSPRKAERRPIYVLNIHLPPSELDNCLEPTKTEMGFKVVTMFYFVYISLKPSLEPRSFTRFFEIDGEELSVPAWV